LIYSASALQSTFGPLGRIRRVEPYAGLTATVLLHGARTIEFSVGMAIQSVGITNLIACCVAVTVVPCSECCSQILRKTGGRGIICSGHGKAVKVSESVSVLCMHGRLDVRFETLAKSKTVV
jgi:tRNA(Arg) A34 adenosine deaminase TadA